MNQINFALSAEAQHIYNLANNHCFPNHIVRFSAVIEDLLLFPIGNSESIDSIYTKVFDELKTAGAIIECARNLRQGNNGDWYLEFTYYC